MERHKILEMMGELKLAGMRAAFDEVLTNGVKRQHSVQQIVADLLAAEIAEKQARSIRYQVAAAKLPLAKELTDFEFSGSPINEALVRELAGQIGRARFETIPAAAHMSCIERPDVLRGLIEALAKGAAA